MNVLDIKTLVRFRDGFRCTECGMTQDESRKHRGRGLEVHRIVPGSEYSLEGCVTLCHWCHVPKPKKPRRRRQVVPKGEMRSLSISFPGRFRVERQARRLGMGVSAYIRNATTRTLESDEASDPSLSD